MCDATTVTSALFDTTWTANANMDATERIWFHLLQTLFLFVPCRQRNVQCVTNVGLNQIIIGVGTGINLDRYGGFLTGTSGQRHDVVLESLRTQKEEREREKKRERERERQIVKEESRHQPDSTRLDSMQTTAKVVEYNESVAQQQKDDSIRQFTGERFM